MLNNKEEEKTAGKEEDCVLYFLNERKERGFTTEEIMGGLSIDVDFSNPETSKMSTFMIADFTALLYDLVRREKLEMKYVDGRMYFMVSEQRFKCPKCGTRVSAPKKKWEMIGRPDNKGRRMHLVIGIFKCPTHGTFRAAIDKQKIPPK
jgi:hypothetical protein